MKIKIRIKPRNIILGCIFIALILAAGKIFKKKPQQEILPRPVETALAVQQDAAIYIDSFGNLYSPNNIDIKAQVPGKIIEVNFSEGQEVKKGDLLFTIDPAPYQAALDKANAALSQDSADLKLKKLTLERNRQLFAKQLISKQDFDTYETAVASTEAKVRMDNAEIEMAKINLDYCYIRAPADGRTGKRQVDLGNIVSANTGPTLVNIQAINTLYIDFTIPEAELFRVRQALQNEKLKVEVYFDEYPDKAYSGDIELLDNQVDNSTGTVLLRGVVLNSKRELWPGQFCRVRLILGTKKDAVLLPYEAVQIGQKGHYVFVVTKENEAGLRLVKTGSRQKENIVIEEGVQAGERVVTVGQLGLSPGIKVVDVTGQKQTEGQE